MHEIYNTGSKRALEIKLDLCYAPHPPRIRVQETGCGVVWLCPLRMGLVGVEYLV